MNAPARPRNGTRIDAASPQIVVTGIKPTGRPHIGNYVGMIRPTIDLINSMRDRRHFVFVANYHALNIIDTAEELADLTDDVAATLIACGLDPTSTYFYRQSDVPEIFELATILASVTPKGLMNRAHAYKAAVDRNRAAAGKDDDDAVNMGLYTYPILMSADILLFGGDLVPVGQDQVQHVEFARDIAGYFNRKYDTEVLREPATIVQKEGTALPGLDGRKMSKSYGNTIPIFAEPDVLLKRIKRIITDSRRPDETKDPDVSTLFQLFQALASNGEAEEMRQAFLDGAIGYGEAKDRLFHVVERTFRGPRETYKALMSDRTELDRLIQASAEGARQAAAEKLSDVRKAIGA